MPSPVVASTSPAAVPPTITPSAPIDARGVGPPVVIASAGGRVAETARRPAHHHSIGADRRAREPAVEQVALLAHGVRDAGEQPPLDRDEKRVELGARSEE